MAFARKSLRNVSEEEFSDAEIIQALTRNGAAAVPVIKYLYNRVRPLLVGNIIKGWNAEEESWDVFQDGLLILIESLRKKTYQGRSSVRTFLLGVCRNCWYQYLKRKYRSETKLENYIKMNDHNPETILEYLAEKENRRGIMEIFEKLPEKCSEILKLFYWDGFDMASIAQRLGYKDASVAKARKNQCQRFLIDFLKKHPELMDYFYQSR